MSDFKAKRVIKTFTRRIAAPASKVFPLLCPTREYDWIEGWSCDLVYSETGLAENNCVFTTSFLRNGEEIWALSRYEPTRAIEFVAVTPQSHVMKFDVALRETEDGSTDMTWTSTFTALTPKGNHHLDTVVDEHYETSLRTWTAALNHFCTTGNMLSHGSH